MFTILTGVVRHAKILQCTNLEIFPGKLASYSEYSERHSFPNYQSFLHICYKQPIYFSKYTASVKALLWLSLWLQMKYENFRLVLNHRLKILGLTSWTYLIYASIT